MLFQASTSFHAAIPAAWFEPCDFTFFSARSQLRFGQRLCAIVKWCFV